MDSKSKIAIVVSHPIQHFCPQYASYANYPEWNLKVFFASSMGYRNYNDKDFERSIAWSNLKLESFPHEFLNGEEPVPVTPKMRTERLIPALTDFAPDVVITYGYAQDFQRNAVQWAKKHHKKVFYIADSENAQRRPWWKEMVKQITLRRYFKDIDLFLTVGNHNEHYYHQYGVPLNCMVRVGFSFDVTMYEKAWQKREELRINQREQLGLAKDEILLTMTGKFIAKKRQLDLVQLLLAMEKNSSNTYVLALIGSGPDDSSLKTLASSLKLNKVLFPGFLAPEEIPAWYAATDIYVHASEIEPHSLAISEAAYMECPVILSDRCGSHGPTDDVQIGKNGFVYPCGDILALMNQILFLSNSPHLRLEMGKYGHQFIEESQQRAHGEGLKAATLAAKIR